MLRDVVGAMSSLIRIGYLPFITLITLINKLLAFCHVPFCDTFCTRQILMFVISPTYV